MGHIVPRTYTEKVGHRFEGREKRGGEEKKRRKKKKTEKKEKNERKPLEMKEKHLK